MKCEQIKDLVLTDYIDGQMEADDKQLLEEHLKACRACHEFALSVQKELVTPFGDAPRPEVPPAVWQKIKAEITAEEEPEPGWKAVVSFLGNLQALRQAAYFLAGFAIVFGVTVVLMRPQPGPDRIVQNPVAAPQQLAAVQTDEETSESVAETYLAALDNDYDDVYSLIDDGYGTAIEEYFL